jgi:hypothetical protein
MKVLKRIGRSTIEILIALLLFFVVLGTVSYFAGLFKPVTVNKYILSNGSKTVVFQEMRHIGTGNFYKQVNDDIQYYRNQGYVFGYEGIFFIGGRELYADDKIDYTQSYMEQPMVLGGLHKDDVNLDLNWIDISNKIEKKIKGLNEQNKTTSGYVNQTIMDIPMLKNEIKMNENGINLVDYTVNNLIRIRYFENLTNKYNIDIQSMVYPEHPIEHSVIMDDRNKIVADFIQKEARDKILINYGAQHFDGIFKLLKDYDSNWKIIRFESREVL